FLTVQVGLFSLLANVILRYGFNYSLAWSEELIRLIIIYTTFIGCSAAIKQRNMIVIDALPQVVPRLKIPLAFLSYLGVLFFSFTIFYLGWQMVAQQAATAQTTIVMKIPTAYLSVVFPLMGGMMFIRAVMELVKDIGNFFPAKAK
ncbi:MAG: TRAP transporter small permease, partial [Thermodesulfobacteriota bacterium]